ncbi:hypothetical protein ACH0CI_15860 [Priestia sp. 179-F W1.4 NHS]|uniref:hypothetical protein n=1 Tax=Priestia sp. 179-F W1.4 NHS TaxID=3374296 RepID=UPI00387A477E
MSALHSQKIKDERNAFIEEMYNNLVNKELLISGDLEVNSRRLHKTMLPVYIMKHYCESEFNSTYINYIMTNLIECEMLLILGFKNAGMTSLRAAMESSFKFLYYEFHPIENTLHNNNEHNLNGLQYREFLYSFPGLKEISFMQKDSVERTWSDLCKYVHSDIHSVETITYVSEISSVLELESSKFNTFLRNQKNILKIIISIFFAVDKNWVEKVEKTYFDAIFEIFEIDERNEVKQRLQIS